MRVLMIHCAYQLKAGEDAVVAEEVKLLRSTGMEVELLLFDNEGNELLKFLQLPFNVSSYRRVQRSIKQFKPDVVHIHNLHFAASPSVIWAIKHYGVPIVYTLHNYRLMCPSNTLFLDGRPYLDSVHKKFPLKAIRKGLYRNSKALTFWMVVTMYVHHVLGTWRLPNKYIALSRFAANLFLQSKLKLNQEQVTVKPNFTSPPPAPFGPRSDSFVFIGRLSTDKGLHVLLKAFAGCTHKLIIAGDGPLREEVERFSAAHPNVTYAGVLQKEAISGLLQSATALLFPSTWFEGMPLTIIEAFACDTPVLASKLGVMESMITQGYNGLFFTPSSVSDLRRRVDEWAAMPQSEKEVYHRNAGNTYKRFYTPMVNLRQLLAVYESVIITKKKEALA